MIFNRGDIFLTTENLLLYRSSSTESYYICFDKNGELYIFEKQIEDIEKVVFRKEEVSKMCEKCVVSGFCKKKKHVVYCYINLMEKNNNEM